MSLSSSSDEVDRDESLEDVEDVEDVEDWDVRPAAESTVELLILGDSIANLSSCSSNCTKYNGLWEGSAIETTDSTSESGR